MCRGALTALATAVLAATVAVGNAGAASPQQKAGAATPQQIYRDLADNGRLDRAYTKADLDRALSNPSIPGYTRPSRVARTPQVRLSPALAESSSSDGERPLPFTGLDLALFAMVGGPLLLLGASMRRFARTRAPETT